jgi:hypothetical protein
VSDVETAVAEALKKRDNEWRSVLQSLLHLTNGKNVAKLEAEVIELRGKVAFYEAIEERRQNWVERGGELSLLNERLSRLLGPFDPEAR